MTKGQHHYERSEYIVIKSRGHKTMLQQVANDVALRANEVVLRTNDVMLCINDVGLRPMSFATQTTANNADRKSVV